MYKLESINLREIAPILYENPEVLQKNNVQNKECRYNNSTMDGPTQYVGKNKKYLKLWLRWLIKIGQWILQDFNI